MHSSRARSRKHAFPHFSRRRATRRNCPDQMVSEDVSRNTQACWSECRFLDTGHARDHRSSWHIASCARRAPNSASPLTAHEYRLSTMVTSSRPWLGPLERACPRPRLRAQTRPLSRAIRGGRVHWASSRGEEDHAFLALAFVRADARRLWIRRQQRSRRRRR
ncbi:Hypothetical protein A7982_05547 [Minicystis rosea]|nr:Hypothetical protein A7982_05547 [Minicystis rosea]